MSPNRLQVVIWSVVCLALSPAMGMARPYDYLAPNATSPAINGTGSLASANATTTGFPSTSTTYLTTTVTAVSHPPGKRISLMTMITTRKMTTYSPGPVTAYPATVTETIISTGTIERRNTFYNGRSTTLHGRSTATWQVTLTVTDPNPPPPDTTDFTFPYPFLTDTDTGTDTTSDTDTAGSGTITTTVSASTTPPPATSTASKVSPAPKY